EGRVASETFEPEENRVERPAVEAKHKDGVVDALTTFVAARRMVLQAQAKGETKFTLPYYDGRRRTDLNFEIVGSETMKDTKQQVLHVRYTGIPVAGFTANELKKQNAEDAVIDAYASDDGQLLPIAAKGSAPLGVAFGKVTHTCVDFAMCEKEAAK
ncbi:MAG: DUF3108 domain-containing protein, partial [Alphaproteobacteria bacterium]|nr:DUF3108 domain-containing protein [Alphaproteobacteria bacterium]